MRVSEDRYAHDLRRLNLAKRFIDHGLRTHWIRQFTGMSEDQVRNLLRSYFRGPVVQRHRGQPPMSCAVLFGAACRAEASALAGMVTVLRLVPSPPVRSFRKRLPDIGLGERLCSVFELFQLGAPGAAISMDRFMLLVMALAEGRLRLGGCMTCHATILVDPLAPRKPVCEACSQSPAWEKARRVVRARGEDPPEVLAPRGEEVGEQQSLF